MARDPDQLLVEVNLTIDRFLKNAARLEAQSVKRTKRVQRSFDQMEKKINGSLSKFKAGLLGTGGALGGALGVRAVKGYADAWTEAGNKLNSAASIAGVQTRSLEDLNKQAIANRTSLMPYVDLYSRMIQAASGVVKSEQDIADATDTVTKAFKAGGATLSEQNAGIMQLSQGLGSGVLAGDELRSVRENARVLAQAIADFYGTTVAGLKQLGAEGKLTSEGLVKAILAGRGKIEKAYDATTATIGEAFTKLRNNLTQYIGKLSESVGITKTVNILLDALGNNIEHVAAAAAAAGVVLLGAFGKGALVASITALANPLLLTVSAIAGASFAMSKFFDQTKLVEGGVATLGDAAGVVWDDMKAGVSTMKDLFLEVINFIIKLQSSTAVSWSDIGRFIHHSINGIIKAVKIMGVTLVAGLKNIPNAVGAAAIGAMNLMIATIEKSLNFVIKGINKVSQLANQFGGNFGEVGSFDLGRVTNNYAKRGKAAATALVDELKAIALSDPVGDYLKKVTARAEERAKKRTAKAKAISNKGFGTGGAKSLKKSKKGKASSNQTKANSFSDKLADLENQILLTNNLTAAQALLNPLLDDYDVKLESSRLEQELLNEAQLAGVAITPQLREKIKLLADTTAEAADRAEKLTDKQESLREKFEDFKQTASSSLKGFITDLKNGVSATDALKGALAKVADKLQDIVLNSVFDSIGGGGGGGFGKLIASFFADGGVAKGGRPQRLATFSRGGVSKEAAIFGEAGAEAAVPLPDGRRIPVDLRLGQLPNVSAAAAAKVNQSVVFAPVMNIDARGSEVSEGRIRSMIGESNAQVFKKIVEQFPGLMFENRQKYPGLKT